MENLLTTLSTKLQSKLANFLVYSVYIEYNELNVFSEYDLDYSYVTLIQSELMEQGHSIEC